MIESIEPFAGPGAPYLVARGDDWAVLYKPPGMHSASGDAGEALEDLAGTLIPGAPRMLSRLDFPTSGLVLFGTTDKGFARLKAAMESGSVRKGYLLRANGGGDGLPGSIPLRLEPGTATLDWPDTAALPQSIVSRFRSYGPKGAAVACVAPEAADRCRKPLAPSLYRTEIERIRFLEPDSGQTAPIEAAVAIRNGFRHQIRAHLAWCGWPILGDLAYGGLAARRLFLEACSLEFPDCDGDATERVALYGQVRS